MRKMCLIIVTALIIIICVIAFKSFIEGKEENFDGIFIERAMDEKCRNDSLLRKDSLLGEVVNNR